MTSSSAPRGGDLLLGLNRPQYVSVPEALITALAWELYEPPVAVQPDEGLDAELHSPAPDLSKLALVYMRAPKRREAKTLKFEVSYPAGPELDTFADALKKFNIKAEAGQNKLACALADGIAGVKSTKGGVRAAIPLSPALARLQNVRGLQATANPPALGGILERMFALGAPGDHNDRLGASARWLEAADRRCEIDPLVRGLDNAAAEALFVLSAEGLGLSSAKKEPPRIAGATGLFEGTPYSWFYKKWSLLCSPEWVDALPARVWVDWASTVLRLAVGFGFLWEAAWYESIARTVVLGRGAVPWTQIRAEVPDTLPWKPRTSSTSVLDVAGPLKARVRRGEHVRNALQVWFKEKSKEAGWEQEIKSEHSFDALVARMCEDSTLVDNLTDALSSRTNTGSANNLWEAVRYALLIREVSGESADHYGFLRSRGPRYSVPDPGVEWVAAMASLACKRPGGVSNVGGLLADLRELGLRPELAELVQRLEEAGVARGSADADQAVEIRSAF